MKLEDFVPSKSERIGLAMRNIIQSPDWQASFGPLIEQELLVAQDDIAQAEDVKDVWKAVGRLQAYRYVARAITLLTARAEKLEEVRLKKIQQIEKGKKK